MIPIVRGFVDSTDGVMKPIVNDFCYNTDGLDYVFASYGVEKLKDGIKDGKPNQQQFKAQAMGSDVCYAVNTTYYKQFLYNALDNANIGVKGHESFGYCHFPKDYPDEYFKQLTSEDRLPGDKFRLVPGRRNEALDCRVYAMAAGASFIAEVAIEESKFRKIKISSMDVINYMVEDRKKGSMAAYRKKELGR